jgi:uncharacterized protein (DUF934 family)
VRTLSLVRIAWIVPVEAVPQGVIPALDHMLGRVHNHIRVVLGHLRDEGVRGYSQAEELLDELGFQGHLRCFHPRQEDRRC